MRRIFIATAVFLLSLPLFAQNFDELYFGTDSTLEVMTWNIEWFPKSGQATIDDVSAIIEALDVDVIAIQEIDSYNSFIQMVEDLQGWDGYAVHSEYLSLAYIYNPAVVEVTEIYPIFTSRDREFPRPPLVMEMTWEDQEYVIINNHLKCCGDGYLNTSDPWDEETRRYDACILLEQFISSNMSGKNVFMVGDLNDMLTDVGSNNVFNIFLSEPESYKFSDMSIAEGTPLDWSYPTWPSHLDHIMITNELFEAFNDETAVIRTMKIEEAYNNNFYEYEQIISDHRPVAIKIPPVQSSSIGPGSDPTASPLQIFPNPCNGRAMVLLDKTTTTGILEIFDLHSNIIHREQIPAGTQKWEINLNGIPNGTYQILLKENHRIAGTGKLIIIN